MSEPTEDDEPFGVVAAGGWCAPSDALYNMIPNIGIRRGGVEYPTTPYVAPVPPTRLERLAKWWRRLRKRASASWYAMRKAWKFPDGWWEVD